MVKEQEWLPARGEPGNHTTDPYIERMAFLFGRWQVGESVPHEGNSSCFLTFSGCLGHRLNNVRHVSCSQQTQEKNTYSHGAASGLDSCSYSSSRAHSGSSDLKAYLSRLARADTSCGRAIQAPVETNQWPHLSHKGVRTAHLSDECSEAIKECGT